ncbi:MAG: hypothetical protein GWN77_00725 [Gammaproteobacteria bacterium]|nr:hypothetical protein [Gammaproteobacteria bacterium]
MKKMLLFTVTALLFLLVGTAPALAEAPDCTMCHPQKAEGDNIHPAVGMGCAVCHASVDATNIPHDFGGQERGLAATGADLCFMCHDKAAFSSEKFIHMPVVGGMCTGCHDPHVSANSKLLVSAVPDLCYNCHEKEKFYGPTVHQPVASGMCTMCHTPHQSAQRKLLAMPALDLCMMCHDREAFFKKSTHRPVKQGQCTECHDPHAGQNDKLVLRKGNLLCRKCHANVERTPHAISGFSASGHPVRGRKDPLRQGKTFGCPSCHVPHSSESPTLFRYKATGAYDLCTYCHEI